MMSLERTTPCAIILLLYADGEQPGFFQFCLPSCCLDNPDIEVAWVQLPKILGWVVDNDYTNKKDGAADEWWS